MLRGINSAVKGMLGSLEYHDVIANNLANVNSTGFKQSKLIFKDIQDAAIRANNPQTPNDTANKGSISLGSAVDAAIIDFSQGGLKTTGNTFDLALKGDGFFVVEDDKNQKFYTRNGSFKLQDDGTLATLDGKKVLGEDNAPITININKNQADDINILADGSISVKKAIVGKIQVVDFEDKINMKSLGNSMFLPKDEASNPLKKATAEVVQGSLETSNASVVETMISSISAQRLYETLSTVIQENSKSLEKTINQVGSVRR